MTFKRYVLAVQLIIGSKNCQIVSTDDYMPMPIGNLDEYDKVVNVSWFTPDKPREDLTWVSTPNYLVCF